MEIKTIQRKTNPYTIAISDTILNLRKQVKGDSKTNKFII